MPDFAKVTGVVFGRLTSQVRKILRGSRRIYPYDVETFYLPLRIRFLSKTFDIDLVTYLNLLHGIFQY